MRIRCLLMPVSPDLSGSFAAIPDHVPPAGLGWGAGTPPGAVRLTQGMDGARDERHPSTMPRPDFSSFFRASQLAWANFKRHIDYDMSCDAFASKSDRDCCRASVARSGEHNPPFVTKGIFGG